MAVLPGNVILRSAEIMGLPNISETEINLSGEWLKASSEATWPHAHAGQIALAVRRRST